VSEKNWSAVKLSDIFFVLKDETGKKVLKITKILGGFYVMGSVEQQFNNSKDLDIIDFCKTASKEELKKKAHYHKKAGVSKTSLHKGFDELLKSKEIDIHTFKRLVHMTKDCNCSSERMYYRLKNILGVEREHVVDKLNFRIENENMETSLNEFTLFCETLRKQEFKFRTN